MFETLSQRLTHVFDKLRGRGALSEADVDQALRDIRMALLEADVALPAVKSFISTVREKAVGTAVLRSITPGQMVIKIVHDHLVELLNHPEGNALNLAATPPVVFMMVGLQGSGKTTTTVKLARFLTEKLHKKVLVASVDVYRPAAQEQLRLLSETISIPTLDIIEGEKPLAIAKRAREVAQRGGFDVLLIDTAGRLHLDETLMAELKDLDRLLQPKETLLVVDAMMGKDALTMAQAFNDQLHVTGFILSRIDGDARGGAALSIRFVTGKPLKFLGTGEKPENLEPFYSDRVAGRILGQGDVVSLVEKMADTLQQEEMEKAAHNLQKGVFTLEDMARSLEQMQKMGGMSSLLDLLPGLPKLNAGVSQEASSKADRLLQRQKAILSSMTPLERKRPGLLNASRKRRIAMGSGTSVPDVNRLLKQYEQMSTMMKRMGKWGQKGLMRQGFKNLLGM